MRKPSAEECRRTAAVVYSDAGVPAYPLSPRESGCACLQKITSWAVDNTDHPLTTASSHCVPPVVSNPFLVPCGLRRKVGEGAPSTPL